MSRLTCLEELPRLDPRRALWHAYRRIGNRVLVTRDSGAFELLSPREYRERFGGRPPRSLDLDAEARLLAERGPLAWRGPALHVLVLGGPGGAMSLETARRAVDFAFSAPGGGVRLELVSVRPEAERALVWFIARYARRKSEWYSRGLGLWLRLPGEAVPEALSGVVSEEAVPCRARVELSGSPPASPPSGRCARVLARVGRGAADPAGWIDRFRAAGAESVLLEPSPELLGGGLDEFLGFYRGALGRMLGEGGVTPLRDEWAAGFLARAPHGLDVVSELAYGPDGGIYSSEAALAAGGERSPFRLGELGSARLVDLGKTEAARACLAAACADNQPLCQQCAYKPYCAVPPSAHHELQGTVWGQTPSSVLCALRMGILDELFGRLHDAEVRRLVEGWAAEAR